MSRFPRSIGLPALLLLVLLAAFFLRPRPPAPLPTPLIPHNAAPRGDDPEPDESATPVSSESTPAKELPRQEKPEVRRRAKLKIFVNDVFGQRVKGARVRLRYDDHPLFKTTNGEGLIVTEFELRGPNEIQGSMEICCGDLSVYVDPAEGEQEIHLPQVSGKIFGEVVLQPRAWSRAGIRLKGNSPWDTATAVDDELGLRFLYRHPGTYEVTDESIIMAQYVNPSVEELGIVGGQRTTLKLNRNGAIALELDIRVNLEALPTMFPVRIRGVSQLASRGTQVSLMVKNGQHSYTQFGLAPGHYEVSCDEPLCRFSQSFVLEGGELRRVKLVVGP